MATVTAAPTTLGPAADTPYLLTIDDYSRMVETGLIPEDRRVYLLDGRLYEKVAKTKAHGWAGASINRAVGSRLLEDWSLWPESTVILDRGNAPLPDFVVLRGTPADYARADRYPESGDIGLLIEIGVSSLRADLTTRLEQYARASVPAYWVFDVLGRRIVVHAEPRVVEGRGEYGRVETIGPGQSVPLVLDGREVARIPFEELLR